MMKFLNIFIIRHYCFNRCFIYKYVSKDEKDIILLKITNANEFHLLNPIFE
jgi:hypothetical protein